MNFHKLYHYVIVLGERDKKSESFYGSSRALDITSF